MSESLNKLILRAKKDQIFAELWSQLAPQDLDESVQYAVRNTNFRRQFLLARFQTLTPPQLLSLCLAFPDYRAELLGKQLTSKNVGPWLEKFKYLVLLFATKSLSHQNFFYICAVKECETVDLPQTFEHILPINLFSPQNLAQRGREFVTTQNLARVFMGGENFWTIAPQVGLGTDAESLLFYYQHQNVPNPLAPFLDTNGKFINDANHVQLFNNWLNSAVNSVQEMPIELLNPDIFRHWWLDCHNIFKLARFSLKWLIKYGHLVSTLEPDTKLYEKFLGNSQGFAGKRDEHWRHVCTNQDLPEEFFYYFRDQDILRNATSCKTQFSPKLSQFWRLIDSGVFCLFKQNISAELFSRLYCPKYYNPTAVGNFGFAKYSYEMGEICYNETKWSKTDYKPIGGPDNTILQTLYNLSLQTTRMPIGGWPLEPNTFIDQVKLMLRFNNPVASIFTPKFCADHPQLVEYAIKWCTLSDECIFNILESFDRPIEQILNASAREIFRDVSNKYSLASSLLTRQTLPATIVSRLVAQNITRLGQDLPKWQKFSNDDIDVWIGQDPARAKSKLELLFLYQDFSPENTRHLCQNYCDLIKEYKFSRYIKPQEFLRSEILQIFDENSDETRLALKLALQRNYKETSLKREITTVSDVQTIAQFLYCRPHNLDDVYNFLDTAAILRNLLWIPFENICDKPFKFDHTSLVMLFNRTRFPTSNFYLDAYRYFVTIILQHFVDYSEMIAQVFSSRFVFDAANFDETFLRQNRKLFKLKDIFEYSNTISAEFVRDHIRSNKDVFVLVKNNNYRKWLPKLQVLLPEFAWPIC